MWCGFKKQSSAPCTLWSLLDLALNSARHLTSLCIQLSYASSAFDLQLSTEWMILDDVLTPQNGIHFLFLFPDESWFWVAVLFPFILYSKHFSYYYTISLYHCLCSNIDFLIDLLIIIPSIFQSIHSPSQCSVIIYWPLMFRSWLGTGYTVVNPTRLVPS